MGAAAALQDGRKLPCRHRGGYYGAYQFTAQTWRTLGYEGLPHKAPPAVQDEAARRLQTRSGWDQWPRCSRKIGVR